MSDDKVFQNMKDPAKTTAFEAGVSSIVDGYIVRYCRHLLPDHNPWMEALKAASDGLNWTLKQRYGGGVCIQYTIDSLQEDQERVAAAEAWDELYNNTVSDFFKAGSVAYGTDGVSVKLPTFYTTLATAAQKSIARNDSKAKAQIRADVTKTFNDYAGAYLKKRCPKPFAKALMNAWAEGSPTFAGTSFEMSYDSLAKAMNIKAVSGQTLKDSFRQNVHGDVALHDDMSGFLQKIQGIDQRYRKRILGLGF